MQRFKTIVADPPWPYSAPANYGNTLEHRPNRDKGLAKIGAGSKARYGVMAIQDICDLHPEAEPDAHLYLWFTNAFAVEAHTIARAWGFKPSTILTWVKIKPDGTPSMKMGYNFRGATEHVLFAVRGKLRTANRATPTAFLWPRTPHSVKPDAFFDLVEKCSPGPYLEMFARKTRLGWTSWGNEVPTCSNTALAI